MGATGFDRTVEIIYRKPLMYTWQRKNCMQKISDESIEYELALAA